MATRPEPFRWTYEQFARLPAETTRRYEIIAGRLYVTPSPRSLHQLAAARLRAVLTDFVEEHGLGWMFDPVDVLFAEGDFLEPDLVFVRRERRDVISERGIEAAPDLVVEVLSRSTAARDRGLKRERYARYGVPEYWVVDADGRTIDVYRLEEDPEHATRATDALEWQPVPGGPTLSLSVPRVLRGLE